jgi:nucleotide-binding universal stress UspA family protein
LVENTYNKDKNFSKILVAIDGSHSSMKAAEYAIELARKNKSQLIVLYVIDAYKYPYLLSSTILAPTFGMEKFMEEKKEAKNLMEEMKEKYLQSTEDMEIKNLKTEIIEGKLSVAATIVEQAELENADLIVMGSRGKTGFKKMLIGSVSLDVVKYAHCSVLIKR